MAAADERLAGAGVIFELSGREERSDLVAVVRLLLELGVLARVAGDEEAFVRDAGDVLYDVQRRVLAVLMAAPRGPSTIVARDVRQPAARAHRRPESRIRRPPHPRDPAAAHAAAARRSGPLLRRAVRSRARYLTSQRAALTQRISERTGLVAEIRAEGIAMVDPSDDLTDVRMPEAGTDGHVALLARRVSGEPRGRRRSGCPTVELHALVRGWRGASGVLASQHARPGRRGRARGTRAGAARGTAADPTRTRRLQAAAGARPVRAGAARRLPRETQELA